jgi:SAM-dependent methyltransferase
MAEAGGPAKYRRRMQQEHGATPPANADAFRSTLSERRVSPAGRTTEAMRIRDLNRPFIGMVAAWSLGTEGAAAYLDALYQLLLGRPAEDEALTQVLASLAAGETNRAEVARWIVHSREFQEAETIYRTLIDVRARRRPFDVPPGTHYAPDTTERVVEVPWVLSRWAGEQRVLDLGYAYASGAYLTALLDLPIGRLHGIDWSPGLVPRMARTRGDLRAMPYRSESFELVVCISTIEHVGMNNTRYGVSGEQVEGGDAAAFEEIERVLARGGRLLITIPFGRRENHGWFRQYDSGAWERLTSYAPSLRVREQRLYGLTETGWSLQDDPRVLERISYGDGAPAARGVLCADLVKPV